MRPGGAWMASGGAITTHPHYPWWKVQEGDGGWTRIETRDLVDISTRLRHYVPRRHTMLDRALSELTFGAPGHPRPLAPPGCRGPRQPRDDLRRRLAAVRAALTGIPTIVWVQDIYTLGARETGAVSHGAEGKSPRWSAGAANPPPTGSWRSMTDSCRVLQERPVGRHARWTSRGTGRTRQDGRRRTRRRAAPWELGWADDDVIVLHAGNIGAKQGLEATFVHASLEAARRGSHVKFVLLGDGNQRPALEAMAARSTDAQFLDPLPDGVFERALASADILLVNEAAGAHGDTAVPSKLTTYFATGLPVIAAADPVQHHARRRSGAAGAGPCVPGGRPGRTGRRRRAARG